MMKLEGCPDMITECFSMNMPGGLGTDFLSILLPVTPCNSSMEALGMGAGACSSGLANENVELNTESQAQHVIA